MRIGTSCAPSTTCGGPKDRAQIRRCCRGYASVMLSARYLRVLAFAHSLFNSNADPLNSAAPAQYRMSE
ncbi:hypothetical protein AGR1B_pAt30383 [Agrobacterium fabacearum S56]|nr:hypothetical protein AGR1B_pAt30383 [Agrobacterium fabacearum S56]